MVTSKGITPGRVLLYLFIVLYALMMLTPILWVLKMSLVTDRELYATPPTIWPTTFTLDSYTAIFTHGPFSSSLVNSTIVAGLTTVVCLLIGSLAAYALARLKFFLASPIQSLILAVVFFPTVSIIAPLFLEFRQLHIINTYAALIVPDTLFSLPLTVWLLVTYFKELPRELDESARVDGAGIIGTLRWITMPLAVPGMVTAGLLTFIYAWNEFLFANTFSFTPSVQPSTVVIPNFATIYTVKYGWQAAAAIVVTVPLVILVFLFQRRIVSGLTAGAVK